MKNAIATTALIFVAALSASASFAGNAQPFAGEGPFFTQTKSSTSALARTTVKADYLRAKKAGTLQVSGEVPVATETSLVSSMSRSAVKAEYKQAQKAGTLPPAGNLG